MAGELTEEELAFLRGVLDMAREGRTEELAEVVERGVPVNLTGGSGDSLLILAAYHDHPGAVRMLLERGADPDRVNDRGQTALGAAVFRRSAESVGLLLEHGADPDAGGRSAREIAAFFELGEMAALLDAPRMPALLLRAAYRAFNARDIDAALALMHPDVDWPNAWEGGRVVGHDAVRDYWTRQFAAVSSIVEPGRMAREADGSVVVDVRQVVHDARSGDLLADGRVRHRYRFEDGLVVRMDVE